MSFYGNGLIVILNGLNNWGKMRRAKRWRYYCDYCKKSGWSKWYMARHEKVCTKNPNRECGFCEHLGNIVNIEKLKLIVEKTVSGFYLGDWSEMIQEKHDKLVSDCEKDLLKESDGCPACSLAAIRQTKDSEFIEFDYKKAKDQFWADNPREEPEYYYDY